MKNFLQRRNDRLFGLNFWDDPLDDFFKPVFLGKSQASMRTDIKEREKDYELSIDMPGFDKKDINVNLEGGYLTVEAKKEEKEEESENYLRRERSYSCSRRYYVGEEITKGDVRAKYENGTLCLVIPKKEEKQIPSGNIDIE